MGWRKRKSRVHRERPMRGLEMSDAELLASAKRLLARQQSASAIGSSSASRSGQSEAGSWIEDGPPTDHGLDADTADRP